jgi:SAM-dependent methyltransferase
MDAQACNHDSLDQPSAWVRQWVARITPAGRVLDVACGGGRHARLLAALGYRVEAVDRDAVSLRGLAGVAGVTVREADLEGGPWPYAGRHFDAVIVTHYLHRPLFSHLLAALAPGGVLIYETFAAGNERYGRPRNPDFLLQPGELLTVAHGRLEVIAYENLAVDAPRPAMIQRMCAINGAVTG